MWHLGIQHSNWGNEGCICQLSVIRLGQPRCAHWPTIAALKGCRPCICRQKPWLWLRPHDIIINSARNCWSCVKNYYNKHTDDRGKKRKGFNLTWRAHRVSYETMRRDDRMLVCSRWQQSVESDSTPADPTEEETLPWTLLHGVRLSVTPQTAQLIVLRDVHLKHYSQSRPRFIFYSALCFLLHDSFQSVLFCIFFLCCSLPSSDIQNIYIWSLSCSK